VELQLNKLTHSLDTHDMNINPESLKNLKKFAPKWKHGKTQTIRVAIALADQILNYAKQIDNGGNKTKSRDTENVKDSLIEILAKVEAREKGYKSNSATQLIRDLKDLIDS